VPRAHLVGHSLGGWAALEVAAAHPERVASVTALAPAGMRDVSLLTVPLALRANRYLAIAARPLLPLALRSERVRGVGFARNSPVWRQWSIETCRDAAEAMAASPGFDAAITSALGHVAECTLRIPPEIVLTVVFGDADALLSARSSQSRRYMPPHGRWLEWERCGHAIPLDCPDRVVALVREVTSAASVAQSQGNERVEGEG
jgi:pimeloyl-ACP methyl ester carboxylesterase